MTSYKDLNWCIARPGSLGVYNLYFTEQDAINALAALKIDRPEYADASVMFFDDWHKAREEEILSTGLQEIDAEAYDYALNVLPPLQWRAGDGVDRFCMSEFTYGKITTQYATIVLNGIQRYFTKPVRYNDLSTYITARSIEAFDQQRQAETPRRVAADIAATTRPGDAAAAYADETGCDYATALVRCNMD